MKQIGICVLLLSTIGVCQNADVAPSAAPENSGRVGNARVTNHSDPELRLGLVTDFPVGTGYSHPRIGGEINGDIFTNHFWFSGGSRLLWAGKVDGGPGFTFTNEGTANLGIQKNVYLGGGALWTITSVRDYSKSALHPLVQAGARFRLGKTDRLSLLLVRYTAAGTDRRNNYREIGGIFRVPLGRRMTLEQSSGVSLFHATDNSLDERVGFDMRWTLSYQLRGRHE